MSLNTISPENNKNNKYKKLSIGGCPIRIEVKCRFCKSYEVVKYGKRQTKKRGKIQRWKCGNCSKTFTVDEGFLFMKNNHRIVTYSLDVYCENLSSRKVKRSLKKYFETDISHVAILDWIRKYHEKIGKFVSKLKLKYGERDYTDETTIRCNGKEHQFGVIMNRKTRFIKASQYWEKAGYELKWDDIRQLWEQVKDGNKRPKIFQTDGLSAYDKAYLKVFYTNFKKDRVKWIRHVTSKTGKYNYIMERFFETLKEKFKIIKTFHAEWSSPLILQSLVMWYNWVRPHMGIDNLTPAQKAGFGVELGLNRWLGLIRLSV